VGKWLRTWASAVAVSLAAAANAATFTVDSPADKVDAKPGDGKCATDLGTCTLRAAIQEANEQGGGTINLNAGTYVLSIPNDNALPLAATGDLDVYGELTITGGGADRTIVDGGGINRVFAMQVASRVTLSDLTVRNGRALSGEEGGGIVNHGNLILDNVTVTNNRTTSDETLSAGAPGGGIFNDVSLQLRRCKVTGNTAADVGGGIHNKGIITVLQSTISGNSAASDRGGGLSNFNTATIILSTIAKNTAVGTGGGIENGGKMTLTHSAVTGNVAEYGGGIHNVGGLDVTDSTIAGNTARRIGGGIHNEFSSTALNGTLRLNNVTIANNTAGEKNQGEPGGGGLANKKPATTKIANSLLAGNTDASGKAPDCRGTLLCFGYDLVQTTTGCKVRGNPIGNVLDQSAKLGPLANNGGPTQTIALLPGSPAIDAGSQATPGSGKGACEKTDQRGKTRPIAGAGRPICDIGAFEYSK
jgi:CSLREA domain-containing protein